MLAHDEAVVQEDGTARVGVRARSLWAPGSGISPAVMSLVKDAAVLVDGEVDYTIHIDVATGLVRKKLDEVEAELKRMLKRDEAFVRALQTT